MSIDYISSFTITELDGGSLLTYTVFETRAAAEAWMVERADDIAGAMREGSITGALVTETRTPARFFVTSPAALPYLAFGAKVVEQINAALIVGVPVEHAGYLEGRLASGLIYRLGPFDSLQSATDALVPQE